MPYTVGNAPVKNVLPKAALALWVETFNAVEDETDDEDQARKAAWHNVKKAGYKRGGDGKWHKASAEIADAVTIAVEELRPVALERAVALALPPATPSKVYAEFRLFRFGIPNDNHDGFRSEDVSDEVIASLIGSPIYLDTDWDEHPERDKRATERARFQAGAITSSERRDDGVYCIGAFQREILEDRKVDPARLVESFSTSMEVMFDRAKAQYGKGEQLLAYQDALAQGIASPLGTPDDRSLYDVRYIVPMEFHAAALLIRGRNADKGADVLRAAAAEEEKMAEDFVLWAEVDVEGFLAAQAVLQDKDLEEAEGAVLKAAQRKKLPKSAFAYVDEKGEGHLPIHDAAHAKNALARLSQTDISEAAKKKALRKILAALRRFGIKPNMDSPAVKAYSDTIFSAMHGENSMEKQMRAIQDAFYKEFSKAPETYPYIRETHDDHVIAEIGEKMVRVKFKKTDDGIEFGKPEPGQYVFKPDKGAAMAEAETNPGEPEVLTPEKRKEVEDAAIAAAKPDIEKAAVEAYLAKEKAFADRMKSLDEISPVTDAEKADLEKKVREADEAGFTAIKMERMEAALAASRKGKTVASKDPVPTLRGGGPAPEGDDNPFRVTISK